jgi:hypothetical protein
MSAAFAKAAAEKPAKHRARARGARRITTLRGTRAVR